MCLELRKANAERSCLQGSCRNRPAEELIDNPELMAKELHLDDLTAKICSRLFMAADLKYSIKQGRSEARFIVECDTGLVPKSGIFSAVLETFSTCITCTPETGCRVWIRIGLSYESFDHGHNGMAIATLRFEDGKWIAGYYKGEPDRDAE